MGRRAEVRLNDRQLCSEESFFLRALPCVNNSVLTSLVALSLTGNSSDNGGRPAAAAFSEQELADAEEGLRDSFGSARIAHI